MKQREKLWTPGKWYMETYEGECYARPGIESDGITIVLWGAEGDDEGVHGASSQQANANAKLMSAAPDLVEALESMLSECEDDEFAPHVMDAKAALAKAYGEAQ